MTRRPHRNHIPGFKAEVALAANKGDRTIPQCDKGPPDFSGPLLS